MKINQINLNLAIQNVTAEKVMMAIDEKNGASWLAAIEKAEKNFLVPIKVISPRCDICGQSDTDTIEALKRFGWELRPTHEFCPDCSGY